MKNLISSTKSTNSITVVNGQECLKMLFSDLELKVIASSIFNSYINDEDIVNILKANLEDYYIQEEYLFGPLSSHGEEIAKQIIMKIIKKIDALSEKEINCITSIINDKDKIKQLL